MDTTTNTRPHQQWVMVTDGQGRQHLEARWVTDRPGHSTAQAA